MADFYAGTGVCVGGYTHAVPQPVLAQDPNIVYSVGLSERARGDFRLDSHGLRNDAQHVRTKANGPLGNHTAEASGVYQAEGGGGRSSRQR